MVYIIIGLVWALFSELGSSRWLAKPQIGDQVELPDGTEGEVVEIQPADEPALFQLGRMALNVVFWPLASGVFLILVITQRKGG